MPKSRKELPRLYTHETYLSPFTWRYGSGEMRHIWSLGYQRRLWRRIWVALAEAQQAGSLVMAEQVEDLRANMDNIDINRSQEIEAEIRHDLMAEVRAYAEQCPVGGRIIHLGATSMDIEDNADALRLRESVDLLVRSMREILELLAALIDHQAEHVCMAFTHLQPAEPTTVGYRLAVYAQDLVEDWHSLRRIRQNIRGKGFKGAVGTSASYAELLQGTGMSPREMEAQAMKALKLEAFPVAAQTYPRRQEWEVLNVLAGLAMTVYKLAFDIRLLQSPLLGEWTEPFGRAQVGSSAMPFKRNPVNAENIDSLARFLASLPRIAWDNAAHSLLERTLDDSGNRRILLPEAFLTADELLHRTHHLLEGLRIDEQGIRRNLELYGRFAATERLLIEAVRCGGDRQELHEIIRQHSLASWEAMQKGRPNPLVESLKSDARITKLVAPERVANLLYADKHIGDAPERARAMAAAIQGAIS